MSYRIPETFRPKPAPDPLPATALTLEWLGTAGFRIAYRDCVLLVDPFVTRPGLARTALLRLRCNESLCAAMFPRADHIVVGHSHYDHVMDVPAAARQTGAMVHGSVSTAAVCRGAGLPDARVHVAAPWEAIPCGAFRATFVPSLHGKALFGRVPFPGETAGAPRPPLRMNAYRHGGAFGILIEAGGFRIYHSGSADLMDDETARVGRVDALLLGLAGRTKTPRYLERMAGHLKPRFLVPQHYDNFFAPLRGGLRLLPRIRMPAFLQEACAVCPEVRLLMPAPLEKIAFNVSTREIIG